MYLHTLTLCLAKPHTHSPMHSLTNSLTHSLTHYLSLTGADEACSTAPTEGWGDGLRSEHAAGEARETDHTASRVWEAPDGSERTAEAATDTAGGTGVVTMTTDHAHNQPAGENNTVPRHCLSELKNQHNLHIKSCCSESYCYYHCVYVCAWCAVVCDLSLARHESWVCAVYYHL